MTDLPFPWNPEGYIKPELEHLFRPKRPKYDQANRPASTYRQPGPECQFTIGKTLSVAERKKQLLPKI